MDTIRWDSVPADVKAAVERFVSNYLRDEYVAYPSGTKVRAPKIIHCMPWGTHRYQPWEVDLVDTPLVQRLRQIHQTAGSFLTFPSSTHSRFEHTLGVVHQASNLMDAIKARADDDARHEGQQESALDLGPEHRRGVRMASILHDTGHGPFSHTSEEAFTHCADMQALTGAGGPFAKRNPHEVLGALIVMSDAFAEFLDRLDRKYEVGVDREWIAHTILGAAEDARKKYLTQIVNGPFDADKLDYIFRDGTFMGVPMAVDLDRLWYGVAVSKRSLGGDDWERILALDQGAASPLEQIVFHKVMLFQTLYHHQKARAVDCMVKAAIEYIQRRRPFKLGDAGRLSLQSAVDFLWLTDETFFAIPYITSDRFLHKLIHDIRYRRLFQRALVISKESIEEDSLPGYRDIRRLSRKHDAARSQECRQIAWDIWERAGKPGGSPHGKHLVWLDLPYPPSGKEADFTFVRRPCFGSPDGYDLHKLSESFPASKWADMYWQNKWRGHVYCPREMAQAISDAAREIIQERFGVALNDLSQSLCHLDWTASADP